MRGDQTPVAMELRNTLRPPAHSGQGLIEVVLDNRIIRRAQGRLTQIAQSLLNLTLADQHPAQSIVDLRHIGRPRTRLLGVFQRQGIFLLQQDIDAAV